jgi:hypothetical protein
LTSSLNDAQHLGTLASALSYNAAGAIAQMTYGNGLVQTVVMNNRLQPCRINVKSSGTAPAQCSDAQPSGNFQDFTYTFTDAQGKNNGNVQSWSGTRQQGFTRSYTYDELNRLSTMASTGTCTGLAWSYDIWANRTAQTTTGGTCGQSSLTINTPIRTAGQSYAPDDVATYQNADGTSRPTGATSTTSPASDRAKVQTHARALDATAPVAGVLTISSIEPASGPDPSRRTVTPR